VTRKVSNSELRLFKSCRRAWWLTYVRELAPRVEPLTGPLALGTKIHTAMEVAYVNDGDPVRWLEETYDSELEEFAEELFEDGVKKLRKERNLAITMMQGFLDWREEVGLDEDLRLFSVEEVIETPFDDEFMLRGKLDQRWLKNDDRIVFRDWKTTASISQSKQLLALDEQMRFYQLLELLSRPEQLTDGAQYVMLRKVLRSATAKPPFYEIEEVRFNRAQAESMLERTAGTLRQMSSALNDLASGVSHLQVVPPNPTRDCIWKCPFFSVCPHFDDGSRVEDMLAEHYEHRDPHERYNNKEEEE